MELGEIGLSSVESGIEHVSVPCRLIVSHPPPTQPGQCDLASGMHRPRFAPTQIAVRPCEQVLDMVVGKRCVLSGRLYVCCLYVCTHQLLSREPGPTIQVAILALAGDGSRFGLGNARGWQPLNAPCGAGRPVAADVRRAPEICRTMRWRSGKVGRRHLLAWRGMAGGGGGWVSCCERLQRTGWHLRASVCERGHAGLRCAAVRIGSRQRLYGDARTRAANHPSARRKHRSRCASPPLTRYLPARAPGSLSAGTRPNPTLNRQTQVVVGPLRSTVSETVALLLGVRDTPQISYGSSSPTLSDTALYPKFFRTFPSDASAAITICQLLSDQLDLARVGVFYSARPSRRPRPSPPAPPK